MAIIALIGAHAGGRARAADGGAASHHDHPARRRHLFRFFRPPWRMLATGISDVYGADPVRHHLRCANGLVTILRGMAVPEFIGPEGYGSRLRGAQPCRPTSCARPDRCWRRSAWGGVRWLHAGSLGAGRPSCWSPLRRGFAAAAVLSKRPSWNEQAPHAFTTIALRAAERSRVRRHAGCKAFIGSVHGRPGWRPR